jgi:outer membrane protein insertion porin family
MKMKVRIVGLVTVWFAMACSPVAVAQSAAEEQQPRIGRVIIVGNAVTRDEFIRQAVNLYPGQVLQLPELREAERRLAKLGIFEADTKKGGPPTVAAIATDDPNLRDILVQVKETRTGTWNLMVVRQDGRLRIRFSLEERNFDPLRRPTCVDDLVEGKAFRGAACKLHFNFTLGASACAPASVISRIP